jgi:hypothetical protein
MYIPRRYGQSKVDICPFCSRSATLNNKQGVPVCSAHKDMDLENFKCICGSFLELRNGKFGPYFYCFSCGNMNFKKALELNQGKVQIAGKKSFPREITVRSDEI